MRAVHWTGTRLSATYQRMLGNAAAAETGYRYRCRPTCMSWRWSCQLSYHRLYTRCVIQHLATRQRRRQCPLTASQATPITTSSGCTCRRGSCWSASPATSSLCWSWPDAGCAAHQPASTCQQSQSQIASLCYSESRQSSSRPHESSSSKISAG